MKKTYLYKMKFLIGIAAIISLISLSFQSAKADEKNLTVVELFTSQGCSSCPPADAFLSFLAKRPDILALSLPVDYWDYIGWKDTFAKPQYTKRQRSYARTQNKYQVYTPQLMINGIVDAVGSNRSDVEEKINQLSKTRAIGITFNATKKNDTYLLKLASQRSSTEEHTLWLAGYQKEATVQIGRGENRGRKVTYTNVVHKLTPIGIWSGGNKSFEVTKKQHSGKNIDGVAVFLQQGRTGQIVAARKLSQ